MPIVTGVFMPVVNAGAGTSSTSPASSLQLSVATIKQLHSELAAVGLTVVGA
jgi:hypothetical protein